MTTMMARRERAAGLGLVGGVSPSRSCRAARVLVVRVRGLMAVEDGGEDSQPPVFEDSGRDEGNEGGSVGGVFCCGEVAQEGLEGGSKLVLGRSPTVVEAGVSQHTPCRSALELGGAGSGLQPVSPGAQEAVGPARDAVGPQPEDGVPGSFAVRQIHSIDEGQHFGREARCPSLIPFDAQGWACIQWEGVPPSLEEDVVVRVFTFGGGDDPHQGVRLAACEQGEGISSIHVSKNCSRRNDPCEIRLALYRAFRIRRQVGELVCRQLTEEGLNL